MVKDMLEILPRKCSFCGHVGHNSRTCNDKASLAITNNGFKAHCVKLFGVNINQEKASSDSIKKSQSMGNLVARKNPNIDEDDDASSDNDDRSGYLSDGLIHNKRRNAAHERKKGTPWTEAEHMKFLIGLKDLGKGDWRGIATKYVNTRTPTQVASHAQKHFIRQNAGERKKRRSSLFDMTFSPEDLSNSPSSPIGTGAEYPQLSSRPQFYPGNTSMELVQRFPHLCLDKYPMLIHPSSNYQPQLYAYSMGVPASIVAGPVSANYGAPSYLYDNNLTNSPEKMNNNRIEFGPIMTHHHHPSGIPAPGHARAEKAASDGLELSIAPPHPKPNSEPTSSSPGAINITDNSAFVVAL